MKPLTITWMLAVLVADISGTVPLNDLYAGLIGGVSGFLLMGYKNDFKGLTPFQGICAVALAAVCGWIAFAVAINQLNDPRYVWMACAITGMLGAKFVEIVIGGLRVAAAGWVQTTLTSWAKAWLKKHDDSSSDE